MNPLRPIWTPEDAQQTARNAAKHVGISGIPDDSDWLPAPTSPARGRHRVPEPARMRPRRAAQLTKITLAVATIITILVVGVLCAEQLGALSL